MEIHKVTVLGAGTMGAGIAQICAQAGCEVFLSDIDPERAVAGRGRIAAFLETGIRKGKTTPEQRDAVLLRVRTTTGLQSAGNCDLLVEAAPEDLALKREIFMEAASIAPDRALLATNTSSLPIRRIAANNPAASRILGMHFFNPVPLMKLLELVVGPATSKSAVKRARAFGERLGKEVIVVQDAPGFASSRLGICLAMEAIRMVEQGVASPEDIDRAMVFGYGHPMGPLRLTDLVGCDVRLAIAEHLAEALEAPWFEPPALLREMVAQGHLGRKSGRGFYAWED